MFLGIPSFCLGLGFLINGCDDGALQRHAVEVRSKDRGRRGRCFLLVKEFRPHERGFLKVEADCESWDRTAPGRTVVLVVGPGRLGWPWLSRIEAP
jgi:hypothetical protein